MVSIVGIYIFGFCYNYVEGRRLNIVIVSVGSLYFGLGVLCRSIKLAKESVNWKILMIGEICSGCCMWLLSNVKNITVDYPAGNFNRIFLNIAAAVNGIVFVFCCAKLLEILFGKKRCFANAVAYISKNTMGIIFFHFLMFKVCIGILVLVGVVDISYMKNLTPVQDDIGYTYMWLFLSVAVLGSVFLWSLCNLCSIGRIACGTASDVYGKWYGYCIKTKLAGFLGRVMRKMRNSLWGEKRIAGLCGIFFAGAAVGSMAGIMLGLNMPQATVFSGQIREEKTDFILLEGDWWEDHWMGKRLVFSCVFEEEKTVTLKINDFGGLQGQKLYCIVGEEKKVLDVSDKDSVYQIKIPAGEHEFIIEAEKTFCPANGDERELSVNLDIEYE